MCHPDLCSIPCTMAFPVWNKKSISALVMYNATRITITNQAWLRWSPSFLCTLTPKAVPLPKKPKLCIRVLPLLLLSLDFAAGRILREPSGAPSAAIDTARAPSPSLSSPLPCAPEQISPPPQQHNFYRLKWKHNQTLRCFRTEVKNKMRIDEASLI